MIEELLKPEQRQNIEGFNFELDHIELSLNAIRAGINGLYDDLGKDPDVKRDNFQRTFDNIYVMLDQLDASMEADLKKARESQEPKIEGVLPVQEKIIDKLVGLLDDVTRRILVRIAKGDISAESGKEELIAEIDSLLDQPFKHEQ